MPPSTAHSTRSGRLAIGRTRCLDVAIPTLNAGPYFQKVLAAVKTQQGVGEVRLLAVDSQSDDDTRDVARRAGARVIEVGRCRFNHGLTRNFALAQTTGDVAILMTQDALLTHRRVFANLLRHFRAPDVAGVCGRQTPRSDLDPIAGARWRRLNRASGEIEVQRATPEEWARLTPAQRMQRAAFDNVLSAIRNEVWQRIPFREVPFAEDRLWARDVLLAGYRLVYDPAALVIHSHAPSLRADLERIYVNHLMMRRAFDWEAAESSVDLASYAARAAVVSALEALHLPIPWRRRLAAAGAAPVLETLRAIWGYAGTVAGRRSGPL